MNFNSTKEKYIFYNFPIVLFCLIPFFLITGSLLSDLAISLIGIFFLVYCFKKKNFDFFKNKYFIFFLFFWSYLIFNSLIINSDLESLKISFFYIRYGIFVIAILSLINFDPKILKYFYFSILICFTILTLDGFYQYFTDKNILGWETSGRVSSFFGEEKILGSYLSRLWPIFFGLTLFFFKKKDKLYLLIVPIFILSEVLIFLSGDRSAFFYINLSTFFVLLLTHKLFKLRLTVLLMSIFLITIISFINPTAKERFIDTTINQMNLNLNNVKKIYIFSEMHHNYYISGLKMFLDNKLFGVGVKNFQNSCNKPKYYVNNKPYCNTHPHNTYIQVLAEIGIVGSLFLFIVLFYFCKSFLKHLILKFRGVYFFSDLQICFLSGIAIYLWPFIPTGNIFSNWLSITMILNLSMLIWSIKLSKNSQI